MTERAKLLRQVQAALKGRPLVWFGTRGDDVGAVADLANLSHSFSIISAYDQRASVEGVALERLSGIRVDLDSYDIDDDPFQEPIAEFRHQLLAATKRNCVVFTYRPSTFLSAVCFARADRVQYLGMFKDHQTAFEHKPWLESAVARLDIPRLDWRYVSDEDKSVAQRELALGPIVVRRSRSSGGVGIHRVDDPGRLERLWPRVDEAFVSVARFVDNTVPVNIGAVIWDDGLTLHYPSVQLIGVPSLTRRPFGYCGNDFGKARDLGADTLRQIEESTHIIGRWMHNLGYRGAFGIDFLVKDGVPLFTEVNPRFQGSSHLSSLISREAGESCIMLDHLAALLHLSCPTRPGLADVTTNCPDRAHLVMHSGDHRTLGLEGIDAADEMSRVPGYLFSDVLVSPRLSAEPGSAVGRFTLARQVTSTGFEISDDLATSVQHATENMVRKKEAVFS